MLKLRHAALIAIALCCVAPAGFAGVSQAGNPGAARCLAPDANAKIVWAAPASGAIQSARVYFRTPNAKAEHFVEMRASGKTFTAVLPKASAGATAVAYRVATAGPNGVYVTRTSGRLDIGKCTPDALTVDDRLQADALVVGQTAEGPVVPIGFRCDGIVGEVTSRGELRAYSACSEQAIAAMSASITDQQGTTPAGKNTVTATSASKTSTGTATANRGTQAEANGLSVGPLHHRTPRRAPQPAQPPQPRLQEPVSDARP